MLRLNRTTHLAEVAADQISDHLKVSGTPKNDRYKFAAGISGRYMRAVAVHKRIEMIELSE